MGAVCAMTDIDYYEANKILQEYIEAVDSSYKKFSPTTVHNSWHWLHLAITFLEREGYDVEICSENFGKHHTCKILWTAKIQAQASSEFKSQACFKALYFFLKRRKESIS